MDALTNIFSRRSIRKFKKEPVEFEKLINILDAGRLAPSSGNVQDWKFLVINDEEKIEKISSACLDQDWIHEAPVVIIVCSEPVKDERMYGSRGKNLYSVQNTACAAQNILLAAHAEGLGACWVGSFDEITLRELFEIPEEAIPRTVIALGYSAESAEEKPKFSLYDVTFFDKWGNRVQNKSELQQLFAKFWGSLKEKLKKTSKILPSKLRR